MKPKIAWLALPLVLAALMLVVKWRAEHPVPTKEDLAIRALMKQAGQAQIYCFPTKIGASSSFIKISKTELAPLIEDFFSSQQAPRNTRDTTGAKGKIGIYWFFDKQQPDGKNGVLINLDITKSKGTFHFAKPDSTHERDLHPITARRWLTWLFANSLIGPQLRSRLKL